MKNLNKLGFIFSVGTLSALSFSLGACGDDAETGGTAGTTSAAGTPSTAGAPSTAGSGGSAAGTASTAGTTSTAGSGGSTAGSGGSTAGSGGSTAGSGGSTAGSGGSTAGSGGSGGGGAGGPSADCKKWCEGDMGLIAKCIDGQDKSPTLNAAVDTVEKCEAHCTGGKAGDANGLSCWIKHTVNVGSLEDGHCGHASGKPGAAGECAEIAQ